MLDIIKDYLKRGDDLPKKEKIIEKTLIVLEIILVISFSLEILGLLPFKIGNYIIVPALFIYILINIIKNFKKSVMLSIMMIISLCILIYLFFKGGI